MLGVAHAASPGETKKAYRTLATRYHPDKHKGNELEELAREKLAALNEAYETLSDPGRRAGHEPEQPSEHGKRLVRFSFLVPRSLAQANEMSTEGGGGSVRQNRAGAGIVPTKRTFRSGSPLLPWRFLQLLIDLLQPPG